MGKAILRFHRDAQPRTRLRPREREALTLAARTAWSNAEMATNMGLTRRSFKALLSGAYRIVGARNRLDLVLRRAELFARFLVVLALAVMARAETLPVLPPSFSISVPGASCSISVIDSETSVEAVCVEDGRTVARGTYAPSAAGEVIGAGQIRCLFWAAGSDVRLQCAADFGVGRGVQIAVDGRLLPGGKRRNWR